VTVKVDEGVSVADRRSVDLADKNGMIAAVERISKPAFERYQCIRKDRRFTEPGMHRNTVELVHIRQRKPL